MKFEYMIGVDRKQIEIETNDDGYFVRIGDKSLQVILINEAEQEFELLIDGQRFKASWAIDGNRKRWVATGGKEWLLEKATTSKRSGNAHSTIGENRVFAPMPGQVRQVLIKEGDLINAGDVLFILEAMKMEIRVLSPRDGKVGRLLVHQEQQVDKDELLLEIE